LILTPLLKLNREHAHSIKHTDSTDIPVCLTKNAKHHNTTAGLAEWGYSGKGLFYGLKMHITTDLEQRMLAIRVTAGNVHDKEVFLELNKDLLGWFIADSAYISKKLSSDFHIEGKRILFAKPRKNMKKLMTTLLQNVSLDLLVTVRVMVIGSLSLYEGLLSLSSTFKSSVCSGGLGISGTSLARRISCRVHPTRKNITIKSFATLVTDEQ